MRELWEQTFLAPIHELSQQALAILPRLLAMLVFLVVGFIVGWVLKQIVYRLLRFLKFDRLCDRLGLGSSIQRVGLARSASHLVGQVIQGITILFALLGGLNALGTPLTRNLVDRFFLYLPHLLAALLVLIVGALISRFLSRSALIAAVNAQMPSARIIAGGVRFFVMTLATVAALDELGISRTTIIVTFAILFGGVVTAGAIALGLGARDVAREFLKDQFRSHSPEQSKDAMRHL